MKMADVRIRRKPRRKQKIMLPEMGISMKAMTNSLQKTYVIFFGKGFNQKQSGKMQNAFARVRTQQALNEESFIKQNDSVYV